MYPHVFSSLCATEQNDVPCPAYSLNNERWKTEENSMGLLAILGVVLIVLIVLVLV